MFLNTMILRGKDRLRKRKIGIKWIILTAEILKSEEESGISIS